MNETTELDETGLRQFLTKLYWECMNSEFTGEVNQQYHSNGKPRIINRIHCVLTFHGHMCDIAFRHSLNLPARRKHETTGVSKIARVIQKLENSNGCWGSILNHKFHLWFLVK